MTGFKLSSTTIAWAGYSSPDAWRIRAVYDRFGAIVVLSAPTEVILDRAADRANPFGFEPEHRTKLANDLNALEPVLRAGAVYEIVTTVRVLDVLAELEQVAKRATGSGPLR